MTITLSIVILTSLVSFSAMGNDRLLNDLIFYPPAITKRHQWYRFFSCGLIHADFAHLLFNMLTLYLFGQFVEERFLDIFESKGKLFYLLMYLCALAVSLLPTYLRHKDDFHYRSLGASGAVSAVVFAGLMIAPYVEVGFFIIPPIIPGFVFGPLYLLVSAFLDKRGGGQINHSAHIWGALFGVAFIIVAGRIFADYDAISACVEGIQAYLRSKGF